jgi:hypothetical protein
MNKFILAASLFLAAPNAFAAEQLCKPEAQKALRQVYKEFGEKVNYKEVGDPDYSVYKNMEGTMVVHYEFNIVVGKGEKSFARVTLSKKNCEFIAGDRNKDKASAEADDQDAAETPVE